jgi:cell wall-associated NlpC family hydrolase
LKPGDAIYFTGHSGNINHTGLYIGNNRILNATHPKVKISSFDPNDKEYYNEHLVNSFAFGKRFIVW